MRNPLDRRRSGALVGAPLITTFSNRWFSHESDRDLAPLDDQGHMRLVEEYLQEAGNFRNLDRSPRRLFSNRSTPVIGESTGPTAAGSQAKLDAKEPNEERMNIRQANGIGRVHVAKHNTGRPTAAGQRRGLGNHHQGSQLHRLRPGRGTGTRTNSQRVALICERWRDSAARCIPAPQVRCMASRR